MKTFSGKQQQNIWSWDYPPHVPHWIKGILLYHDAYGQPKFMKIKVDFVSRQMINRIRIQCRKDT
jgi:hypothetical protein